MKIRTGFVSNSSSSSFTIFGIYIPHSRAKEYIKEINREEISDSLSDYRILKDLLFGSFMEIHESYENNGLYVGAYYNNMERNENRYDFEKRISNEIEELFDKQIYYNCEEHYEERDDDS